MTPRCTKRARPLPPAFTVYRIGTDTPHYTADDVTGTGAKITGGRWNSVGRAVVYAAASRALAALETLVHLAPAGAFPANRYLVELHIPAAIWKARTSFDPTANVGWDAEPPGAVSLTWGDQWLQAVSSLVAVVPSVIVPEEEVVLLNPRHLDLSQVKVRKVRRWSYDSRLLFTSSAS